MSLPQSGAIVAAALKELAEAGQEQERALIDRGLDEENRAAWDAAYKRHAAAVERLEQIAATLYPSTTRPRARRPRSA